MARKSRKKTGSAVCVSTSPAVKPFSTAIYARLSVENSGKNDDGDSIENQVSICREYIEERPYLSLTDVFSDNGAKGTSFERPEFNRMMDMIKAGKINAVVCKDLSRFGRDYIETGNYLEKIFPFLGVRFIAITDHFDSFETDGSEESLMIPLKNMINELYAKDISRKIRTSFDERMAKGEFLPGFIPYGYVKSKTVEYGIDVDEEVAENIKRIFKWRLEGASIPEINRRLNALGATTPAVRKLQLGIWHSEKYNNPEWRGCTVKNILTNPLYTGCLAYRREPKSLYEGIKMHRAPEEEWIVIPDHHEPLVSKEDYDEVQRRFKEFAKVYHAREDANKEIRDSIENLFQGKIWCGECGGRMRLRKNTLRKNHGTEVFYCGRHNDNRRICTKHAIKYTDIKQRVFEQIQLQIEYAADMEKLLSQLKGSDKQRNLLDQYQGELNSASMKLKKIESKLEKLYENYVDGIVSNEEYIYLKKEYDDQYRTASASMEEIRQKKARINNAFAGDNKWLKAIEGIRSETELSQQIVDKMIDRVVVHEKDGVITVELIMNYSDAKEEYSGILREILSEVENG